MSLPASAASTVRNWASAAWTNVQVGWGQSTATQKWFVVGSGFAIGIAKAAILSAYAGISRHLDAASQKGLLSRLTAVSAVVLGALTMFFGFERMGAAASCQAPSPGAGPKGVEASGPNVASRAAPLEDFEGAPV